MIGIAVDGMGVRYEERQIEYEWAKDQTLNNTGASIKTKQCKNVLLLAPECDFDSLQHFKRIKLSLPDLMKIFLHLSYLVFFYIYRLKIDNIVIGNQWKYIMLHCMDNGFIFQKKKTYKINRNKVDGTKAGRKRDGYTNAIRMKNKRMNHWKKPSKPHQQWQQQQTKKWTEKVIGDWVKRECLYLDNNEVHKCQLCVNFKHLATHKRRIDKNGDSKQWTFPRNWNITAVCDQTNHIDFTNPIYPAFDLYYLHAWFLFFQLLQLMYEQCLCGLDWHKIKWQQKIIRLLLPITTPNSGSIQL